MQEVLTIARAQEMERSTFSYVRLAGDAYLATYSVSEAIAGLRERTDRTADAAVWYLDTFYRDDEK